MELTGLISGASDDYTLFIDNQDLASGDAGILKINQATDLIPELQGLIEDFEDDPAGFSGSSSGSSGGASSGDQLITECSLFADYDEAQAYYADTPEAQPYIDPDFDGQACEVFFGRG